MKKSESDNKLKVLKLFESKIDNGTPTGYKLINIRDAFAGRNVEYKTNKDEKLSLKEYLEKSRPHLGDKIDDFKKSGEWKIQQTMKPKFMSSTDSNEKRTMYSKYNSSKFMVGNDTNKII